MSLNESAKGGTLVDSSEDVNIRKMALRVGRAVAEHDASFQLENPPAAHSSALAEFHGAKPKTTPTEFVERIAKYGRCSPCCFTMAMIYIQRMRQKHDGLCLHSENFQRLLGSLVMLATKLVDDQFYANSVWAKVVGIPVVELNKLELVLLRELDFSLFVPQKEYRLFSQQFFGIDATVMDPVREEEEELEEPSQQKPTLDTQFRLSCTAFKSGHRSLFQDGKPRSSSIATVRRLQKRDGKPGSFKVELGRNRPEDNDMQVTIHFGADSDSDSELLSDMANLGLDRMPLDAGLNLPGLNSGAAQHCKSAPQPPGTPECKGRSDAQALIDALSRNVTPQQPRVDLPIGSRIGECSG
mmetsp:Transcript_52834/g.124788  ORF Transcript_52834/g.124788 Transcript_52834/m.124788 type:complete len:355 (-) Transcript_52834:126-1190(-)